MSTFQIDFGGAAAPQSKIVGIDLGTTNSLVAVMDLTSPRILSGIVPSVVSVKDSGEIIAGAEAREMLITHPERTVYSAKRLMGRGRADIEVELKLFPFRVVEGSESVLQLRLGDKVMTPPQVSAHILRKLKLDAEAALGEPVTQAVITVPAYFDDAQRQATRDAGRIAGLDVLRIVNEPTAAALAYGLDERKNGTIAVYDLGGGTFDCSILSISDGVFKVLATNGDTYLGGDDFDRAIMEVAARDMGVDLSKRDPELLQHLRDVAEKVKILLSSLDSAEFVLKMPSRGIDFRRSFTRAEFESILAPFIDRTLEKCRSALRDAGLKPTQMDEVVLVGGSTRIPFVRKRVGEFFGRTPHTELNPDEVVALGAAVQADILTGGRRNMLLLDVIPLSLGMETLGGAMDKLVHRNSTVPAVGRQRYSTNFDNQTSIEINIYQGERELVRDCRKLGTFKLSGIPPMPAMMPQVDVTFLVDANGLLTVTAREQRSGKEAAVTVEP